MDRDRGPYWPIVLDNTENRTRPWEPGSRHLFSSGDISAGLTRAVQALGTLAPGFMLRPTSRSFPIFAGAHRKPSEGPRQLLRAMPNPIVWGKYENDCDGVIVSFKVLVSMCASSHQRGRYAQICNGKKPKLDPTQLPKSLRWTHDSTELSNHRPSAMLLSGAGPLQGCWSPWMWWWWFHRKNWIRDETRWHGGRSVSGKFTQQLRGPTRLWAPERYIVNATRQINYIANPKKCLEGNQKMPLADRPFPIFPGCC